MAAEPSVIPQQRLPQVCNSPNNDSQRVPLANLPRYRWLLSEDLTVNLHTLHEIVKYLFLLLQVCWDSGRSVLVLVNEPGSVNSYLLGKSENDSIINLGSSSATQRRHVFIPIGSVLGTARKLVVGLGDPIHFCSLVERRGGEISCA